MNTVTHIWKDTAFHGFHGGVVMVLVDGNDRALWASPTEVLEVDGRWIGNSDWTVGWSATVPESVLKQIRGITIKQTWDRKDVAAVIQAWLQAISWGMRLSHTRIDLFCHVSWSIRVGKANNVPERISRGGDLAALGLAASCRDKEGHILVIDLKHACLIGCSHLFHEVEQLWHT